MCEYKLMIQQLSINGDDTMKLLIIRMLDRDGIYLPRSLSARQFMKGIKGYSFNQIDDAIWSLYQEGIVTIINQYGSPRIALKPDMRKEIKDMLKN